MSRRRSPRRGVSPRRAPQETKRPTERDAAAQGPAVNEPQPAEQPAQPPSLIDVIPDELTLVRAQLDAGLASIAEGTAARRIAQLEGGGLSGGEEIEGARLLLAEALWRQGRPVTARAALDAIHPSSPQRRRPIAMLIEAEALAASGEPDRAAGLMERAVAAIGVDEAWSLRAGLPSRLPWPLPDELRPEPRRAGRPPWSTDRAIDADAGDMAHADGGSRTAAARARIEAARAAIGGGELAHADRELSIALRLDPAVAAEGVALLEPTLGPQPASDRLLLYGDLLRAAARESDADVAYQRASQSRT